MQEKKLLTYAEYTDTMKKVHDLWKKRPDLVQKDQATIFVYYTTYVCDQSLNLKMKKDSFLIDFISGSFKLNTIDRAIRSVRKNAPEFKRLKSTEEQEEQFKNITIEAKKFDLERF